MLNFSVGQWKQTAANIIVVILLCCLHLDCLLEVLSKLLRYFVFSSANRMKLAESSYTTGVRCSFQSYQSAEKKAGSNIQYACALNMAVKYFA